METEIEIFLTIPKQLAIKTLTQKLEPNSKNFLYIGEKYLAILNRKEQPEGIQGLDWRNDPDLRATILTELDLMVDLEHMDLVEKKVREALLYVSEEGKRDALSMQIREEVQSRIHAYASLRTQMNLSSMAACSLFTEEQMESYRRSMLWIQKMRETGKQLLANEDTEFSKDEKWPVPEQDVIELFRLL